MLSKRSPICHIISSICIFIFNLDILDFAPESVLLFGVVLSLMYFSLFLAGELTIREDGEREGISVMWVVGGILRVNGGWEVRRRENGECVSE